MSLPHARIRAVNPDGTLTREFRAAVEALLATPAATTGEDTDTSDKQDASELLDAIVAMAGAGVAVRQPGGTWRTRSVAAGTGVSVTNGNGLAGNPTVALADLADSGTGTFKLLTRDAKGRLSGTADGDAADVPYDNTASGLSATDVQGAVDELKVEIDSGGGGSGGYLDPRSYLLDPMYDFLGKPPTSTAVAAGASYPWTASRLDASSSIASIAGGATAPGVWRMRVDTLNHATGLQLGTLANLYAGAGKIVVPFRFRVTALSTASEAYSLNIGLADSLGGVTSNVAMASYTHATNSGKFVISAKDSGGATSTGNGVTALVALTWYACRLEINAAGTQIDLYVNDVLEATLSTDVPTGPMMVGASLFKTAGNAAVLVDLDYLGPPQLTFTTPR